MMYFWIILLPVAIWAVWYFGIKNGGSSFRKKEDTPIDILKHRFVNGEITEEEYEEKRAVLKQD
jgi:putative membrane protein